MCFCVKMLSAELLSSCTNHWPRDRCAIASRLFTACSYAIGLTLTCKTSPVHNFLWHCSVVLTTPFVVFAATRTYAVWHCDRRIFCLVLILGLSSQFCTFVRMNVGIALRYFDSSPYVRRSLSQRRQENVSHLMTHLKIACYTEMCFLSCQKSRASKKLRMFQIIVYLHYR